MESDSDSKDKDKDNDDRKPAAKPSSAAASTKTDASKPGAGPASATRFADAEDEAKCKKPTKTKRFRLPAKFRSKKPSDMPRRPLTAYNIFFREQRSKIVAEREAQAMQTAGVARSAAARSKSEGLFESMGKIIAQRWKDVNPQDMNRYRAEADRDSERYRFEMDQYKRMVHQQKEMKTAMRRAEKERQKQLTQGRKQMRIFLKQQKEAERLAAKAAAKKPPPPQQQESHSTQGVGGDGSAGAIPSSVMSNPLQQSAFQHVSHFLTSSSDPSNSLQTETQLLLSAARATMPASFIQQNMPARSQQAPPSSASNLDNPSFLRAFGLGSSSTPSNGADPSQITAGDSSRPNANQTILSLLHQAQQSSGSNVPSMLGSSTFQQPAQTADSIANALQRQNSVLSAEISAATNRLQQQMQARQSDLNQEILLQLIQQEQAQGQQQRQARQQQQQQLQNDRLLEILQLHNANRQASNSETAQSAPGPLASDMLTLARSNLVSALTGATSTGAGSNSTANSATSGLADVESSLRGSLPSLLSSVTGTGSSNTQRISSREIEFLQQLLQQRRQQQQQEQPGQVLSSLQQPISMLARGPSTSNAGADSAALIEMILRNSERQLFRQSSSEQKQQPSSDEEDHRHQHTQG